MTGLTGQRIVLTRPATQAQPWATALRQAGAEPIVLPTSAIAPPADPGPLASALRAVEGFDGFIFTSANAVRAVAQIAAAARQRLRRRSGAWVCAIGPATAAALEDELGEAWRATMLPQTFRASVILATLAAQPLRGQRLLLPQSAEARAELATGLAQHGALVTAVEAYRPQPDWRAQAPAQALFPGPGSAQADAVVFASGSSARHLALLLGDNYRERLSGVTIAVLGPETQAAIMALGLGQAIEPEAARFESLRDALEAHFTRA